MTTIPFVDSILHPTDFSEDSMRAFAHALAIALFRQAKLTLLHVSENASDEDWQHFPAVRPVLERWGLLAPGSQQADVFRRLAVKVRKVLLASDDWSRGAFAPDAFAPYVDERRERMRRLRFSAMWLATLDNEFGDEARERRLRTKKLDASNPMFQLPLVATLIGPDAVPEQAFEPALREQYFA